MAFTDSLPTQDSGGLTIVDERLILGGDIVSSTGGAPRTGVLPSHTNALVTGLASMAVSVASFAGVFSRTGAGVEKAANNGATSVALDTAPGSNSRIDVVWARAQFAASGDSNSLTVFGKTTGTAAASPAKPTIPAGALELATVLVPSTATTTQSSGVVITQTHPYTAMEGGVVLLRNATEQAAWTPHDGSLAYRLDTGVHLARRGGEWKLAGSVTRTQGVLATDSNGFVTITHGLGLTPDAIVVSTRNHPSNDTNTLAFQPVVWNDPDATTFQVRWIKTATNTYVDSPQQVRFSWTAM